eukprot:360719-Chlamydomonas_euryale.AAC.7
MPAQQIFHAVRHATKRTLFSSARRKRRSEASRAPFTAGPAMKSTSCCCPSCWSSAAKNETPAECQRQRCSRWLAIPASALRNTARWCTLAWEVSVAWLSALVHAGVHCPPKPLEVLSVCTARVTLSDAVMRVWLPSAATACTHSSSSITRLLEPSKHVHCAEYHAHATSAQWGYFFVLRLRLHHTVPHAAAVFLGCHLAGTSGTWIVLTARQLRAP